MTLLNVILAKSFQYVEVNYAISQINLYCTQIYSD